MCSHAILDRDLYQPSLPGLEDVKDPNSRVIGVPTSLELCAGAGGQALGLEQATFSHVALIEHDRHACATLRLNRPGWNVVQGDLRNFDASPFRGVDLVAGGVPCPPFSKAGRQLGDQDERDLFPAAIEVVRQAQPRAVMLENVRGLLDPKFNGYRERLRAAFAELGYDARWSLLHASNFGVPQLRPRAICIALPNRTWNHFEWPSGSPGTAPTVGETLFDEMASRGWHRAQEWRDRAAEIAPTLVGGSKKHGGPDLGPTRAKRAWAQMDVDARGLANEPPAADFIGMPRLTVSMAARLQGFPEDWQFAGGKTAAYRSVGNAFPPPVAKSLGIAIAMALGFAIREAGRASDAA